MLAQLQSSVEAGLIHMAAGPLPCLPSLCRIRLPQNHETGHGVILGEGKPENQNAAMIFCFGEVGSQPAWPDFLPNFLGG